MATRMAGLAPWSRPGRRAQDVPGQRLTGPDRTGRRDVTVGGPGVPQARELAAVVLIFPGDFCLALR
jgi:hypothetical protein